FYLLYGYTKEIALAMGIVSVGGQVMVAYGIRLVIGIGLMLSFPQLATMVADYTTPRDRGKAYAMQGMVIGFGSMLVFGVMAQIAKNTGLMSLFYMAGALGLLGLLIAQFGTRDHMPKEKGPSFGFREIYQEVSKSIGLKMGYLVAMVSRPDIVIISTFIILWMVYKADSVGITTVEATGKGGIVMVITSLVTLFAYPILGILVDRVGRVAVAIVGLLFSGTGLMLIAATSNPFTPLMYLYASMVVVGFAGASLGGDTLATDLAPKHMVGGIRGGLNTMQPIGILIFLQVGGFLFDKVGYWAPFALKGVASLLCCAWVIMIKKRIVEPQKAEKKVNGAD
ncbi:MAG: MFS transporter, partial [Deltaproteobacteria bacterium]|nr:MFS transporter [Deltaproteobacteria bacterium]